MKRSKLDCSSQCVSGNRRACEKRNIVPRTDSAMMVELHMT